MKLKLRSTLTIFASAIVFSGSAAAQGNYRSSNDYGQGVIVYEHCDFKGRSETLRAGEYRRLRDSKIGNDSISSIRVPRGSEVVIYEDDDYRGTYARIDRDIRCFDRQWDDNTSSISVRDTGDNRRNAGQRNNRYDDRSYDNNNYDYSRRDSTRTTNRNNGRDRANNNHQNQANVTAKNVAHVVFDGSSLQQVGKNQWSLDKPRSASKQFDEVRREGDSVYLENKYTTERIRIDLFANDVTIVARGGRQQRYSIDRKNAALDAGRNSRANNPAVVAVPTTRSPNRHIKSECFDFKATTRGGNGSLRFHGKDGLYRFNTKASTGRICHKGVLTMEIGKTEPGTDITIEISGNRYRFAAGEKEDKFLNNWYRKSIKLRVGK
jgi:hypothetical protein